MEIQTLKSDKGIEINGPVIIQLKSFKDSRGEFFESWNQKKFDQILNKKIIFVQDNNSISSKGVLRGLHYQLPPQSQGKLVRCTSGSIYDVAVDLRRESKTFGQHIGVFLKSGDLKQFWIPSGFAHGFISLENLSTVNYKTTKFWEKDLERSIFWNDIDLKINWPFDQINLTYPIVSKKDAEALSFKDYINYEEVIF